MCGQNTVAYDYDVVRGGRCFTLVADDYRARQRETLQPKENTSICNAEMVVFIYVEPLCNCVCCVLSGDELAAAAVAN